MFDLFNTFNANTVIGIDDLTGTTRDRDENTVTRFGRATQILNSRIFRLGLRYTFRNSRGQIPEFPNSISGIQVPAAAFLW